MTTLKINFDNEKAAEHFGTWLCEQGEQNYWLWMEYREKEEKGDITATNFIYHSPQNTQYPLNDKRRYENSKFLNNFTIYTQCGRFDKRE